MEIDEKNLSKHIANLMKMDILSNLTLKQARAIALSMEHERLKATEECKHSMLRHNKCVACGETVGPYIQFQLHHY